MDNRPTIIELGVELKKCVADMKDDPEYWVQMGNFMSNKVTLSMVNGGNAWVVSDD